MNVHENASGIEELKTEKPNKSIKMGLENVPDTMLAAQVVKVLIFQGNSLELLE